MISLLRRTVDHDARRHRIGSAMTLMAAVCLTFLWGCAHGNPVSFAMFQMDLLRSAAAALLL